MNSKIAQGLLGAVGNGLDNKKMKKEGTTGTFVSWLLHFITAK